MSENNNNLDFLICPQCQGTGRYGLGLDCPNCAGIGVGTFYKNYFFYWQPKIGLATIELKAFKKQINLIINFVAFSIGLVGLVALLFWIIQVSAYSVRLDNFFFWQQKSPLLLIFWLSVLADFFVIYRFSRDSLASQATKIFKYNDTEFDKQNLNNWEDLKKASREQKIDVAETMNEETFSLVEQAFLLARKMHHKYVTPKHLFFVSLSNREVSSVFARLDLNHQSLLIKLKKYLEQEETSHGFTYLSLEIKQTLISAYFEASKWEQKKVTPKNLLIACLKFDHILSEILYDLEIDKDKINNVVLWFIINEKQVQAYRRYRYQARFKPANTMDKAYTAVATPLLNHFAYDLTIAAKWSRLEYCVAREAELAAVWESLESGSKGILLLGPDGVGKQSLMAGIAQKMVEEDVPKFLLDKRLIELDLSRLVSGVSPAQAEGRMMAIIDEVSRAGNIVLFISNIENIIGISSGAESSMDLAEVLNSAIDRRLLFVFASITPENYFKYLEGQAMDGTFSKIEINEPKNNQAIQIIESKIAGLEDKYNVYFSYNAIARSVEFSTKYMHDSFLPEKAIKILEMAAVRTAKKDNDFPRVGGALIAKIVAEITDIPVTKISDNEGQALLHLEDAIHKTMIGQEGAVKMVSASLRRARTELREGVRPIANFLFLGPTGVGKTELAKTVSKVYFGDKKYMLRIDMSEYQHPDSVKKMIGDTHGVKGHLTELVRKRPFSLILLDEIEKAHPDILNLFLQVMDDGRLTDGQGRLIDFTNSIIIATSNAGANFIQKSIYEGKDIKDIKAILINDYLSQVMRPELINRFDGVIVFEPLSLENVVHIARLMLNNIEKLLISKGMRLEVDENGLRILAKLGYDPKFGARPLRRLLQEKIEDEIANKILAGELKRRDTVFIDETAQVIIKKGVNI